uniref:Globin domain-containing protein n=1 Tax=Oryzias latipes TaxID=8090 RepID=A0A3P9LSR5_ORYLA
MLPNGNQSIRFPPQQLYKENNNKKTGLNRIKNVFKSLNQQDIILRHCICFVFYFLLKKLFLSYEDFYFSVRNMDRIQETHAALSRLHYECVDPDNFKLLGDCITITIACKLKEALNPQVQAVWQKFLCAVVEPMNSQNKSNVDKNQNEVKLK